MPRLADEPQSTLWQRYARARFGRSMTSTMNMAPHLEWPGDWPCPSFDGHIEWREANRVIMLHCWDNFCVQWPLVWVAAVIGRP